MQEETVIIKEELDIDDTKIKLELDEGDNEPTLELSCAGSLMKIIEEQPNMITVPVHDVKSEDELKFIESFSILEQQQKLFVTSSAENNEDPILSTYACKICRLHCENYLALASHQINHQLNRHFCSYGCGYWCDGLDEVQEHEFRKHAGGINNSICRLCQFDFRFASSLAKHMLSHFYVRRFVCALCRRHFYSRQGLQLHRQHSKEICGQLEYVDTQDTAGQLVAASTLDSESSTEFSADVDIKAEPLDENEQRNLQETDNFRPHYVAFKMEPKEEPQVCTFNDGTSLAGKLRGKLRLPSIKKPLKSDGVSSKVPMNPPIQFIPVNKSNVPLIPLANAAPAKRPNILKKKNILQSSKTDRNVAANNQINNNNNHNNILKMLPNNCMVIKLPPNTKIVKLQPTTSAVNTNSCTIGSKIITLPKAMTISQAVPPSAPPPVDEPHATSTVASPQPVSVVPINRNNYFSDLSLFESLPESRKIITEFQNQIRSIEQSLPLPGSVLHAKKSNTNTATLPTQLEVLRMAPTKASNIKVREMRYIYPEHRFHWQCPHCARCYEQYLAFCNHLTSAHNIPEKQFDDMEVEVKTFKKALPPQPKSPKPEVSSPSQVTTPAPPATEVAAPAAAPGVPAPPPVVVPSPPKPDVPTKSGRGAATPRSQQYKCEICDKSFTTVGAVRIHKMIHTGELPHKCNYCDKRFRTPGQVRVHQRRHTGEKPFKCKVCSLDFTHRETLISHLSRHIGMKRYKCYGCDKSFVVVSGLRAHRRLRPDTCGKVKFTARAHGPRVRVIRGEVVFESQPEHNGYLRSEDPLNILSEMNQANKEETSANSTS